MGSPNFRSQRSVMVADSHALGMIGVIRSLGAAGYRVHAVSHDNAALGFYSQYAHRSEAHPSYTDPAFMTWLDEYVDTNEIQAIVPSEGFLHAIRSDYERHKPLLPDAVDKAVWQRCLSKVETQRCLQNCSDTRGANLPAGFVIASAEDLQSSITALEQFSGPYYLKGDEGRWIGDGPACAAVKRCNSLAEVHTRGEDLLRSYDAIVCQSYARGKKVGVSLWRHQGRFQAEAMTLGIHMSPWHGGMMSLRETFWHERLLRDAKSKLEALEWEGVAMMEYKWDPVSDSFCFIEINARFWGYLHVDLFADKDFPRLQMDAFFGQVDETLGPAPRYVRCRHTIPGELGYLKSRLADRDVRLSGKIRSLFGFFARFLDLHARSDLLFPGDRVLYFRQVFRYLFH